MISTVNPESSTIGTVARKRRRQILSSQRTKNGEEALVSSPSKKRCVEPITNHPSTTLNDTKKSTTTAATKTKKPQMRYDPDVPMSKEEAAAWRKEQRRKRNRESAAASRQRQRDRISELEQEVSDWKSKYEEALARIEKLEQLKRGECTAGSSSSMDADCLAPVSSAAVSPCSSPRISPAQMTDQNCGLVSLQDQSNCQETEGSVSCDEDQAEGNHVKHLSEKISRPAVKITGATHDEYTPAPVLSSDALHPDPCTSLSCNIMPSMEETMNPISVSPVLSSEEMDCFHDELEFDKFLLDAAEWL